MQVHLRPSLSPLATAIRLALVTTLSGAAVGVALPTLAYAADGDRAESVLPTVNVTASAQAEAKTYDVKRTTGATKTDTLIRDLPQSMTVISQALIKDQAMQSMADVTRYVPGVSMANGEGNRDAPIFRGSANASGDFYIDGVRDDVEYYRDLYNIDRVEALTGPNAMIFGRGGSGGVINRVSKQADWNTVREASLTLGSYNNRRLTVDVGQAVNEAVAVRVTGLYENSDGYQNNAHVNRSGINPTVAIRADKNTLVTLGFEHFEDRRTADRGVPSLSGLPLNVPVTTFFGDPNPDARPINLTADSLTGVVEHEFANGASLINRTRYTDYDKMYQNYNAGAINLKTNQVAMSAYNNHQWRKNFFNQTDLNFNLDSGAIRHRMLVGMEVGQQETDYLRKTGIFSNNSAAITIPLDYPSAPLPVNFVLGGSNSDRSGSSSASVFGAYVQDTMELSKQFQVIAGLRFDNFKLDYHNNLPAGTGALLPAAANLSSSDNLISPRLGLMYKPAAAVSLYTNYSVASFPRGGDQLSSLNSVNSALKPEKFVNYEIGGKWDINADLLATLAVYRLNRSNVAVVNPVTGIADQLVDGQRTNGIELGISGNLTRAWSMKGGYAYQDAKLLATASATALNGASIGQVPKNTFSLWNRYDVTKAVGAGLGIIRRDDMFASTSNTVVLPGYTRFDGALFYKINDQLNLQLNVENLLDKQYYVYANGDNNITPGSPRAFRVTLNAKM